MVLTERQQSILRAVVVEFATTRRPVGSKRLVELGVVDASSSTIRYELGRLEEMGLLEHPHTSAGRVPTDEGYRWYVDTCVNGQADSTPAGVTRQADREDAAPETPDADGALARHIEDEIESVTRLLAEASGVLSLVTAPPTSGTVLRHVEVLQLKPHVLCVVCITETGEVSRHVATLQQPVDPGLVDWAAEYCNDQLVGTSLGRHQLSRRLDAPGLSASERWVLGMVTPAFASLVDDQQDVHVGGTTALLEQIGSDLSQVVDLVGMLDERKRLLEALRGTVLPLGRGTRGGSERRVAVRIGRENHLPELHPLSVVGTSYGTGARTLGTVGVIGPRAMDYPVAIAAVSAAADHLGVVFGELYGD